MVITNDSEYREALKRLREMPDPIDLDSYETVNTLIDDISYYEMHLGSRYKFDDDALTFMGENYG